MRLLPCLALVSLLLAACATAAPSDPAVGSPPPASAAPQPEESAPQGSPPAMPSPAPVLLDEPVVTVGDDARRLRVYLPDPMPPGPVPLLVFLHPFGGTPSEAVRDTGFDRIAGEEGFVAVFPPADAVIADALQKMGVP